jgi:hypothetical protein
VPEGRVQSLPKADAKTREIKNEFGIIDAAPYINLAA